MTATKSVNGRGRYAKEIAQKKVRSALSALTPLRIGVSLVLAALLVIPLMLTIRQHDSGGAAIDNAVASVFPTANGLDLRQSEVGLELRSTYQFISLQIDNTLIPDDQLNVIAAENRISFRPGEGTEFTSFSPGQHCATATYQPLADTGQGARTYKWCFDLH